MRVLLENRLMLPPHLYPVKHPVSVDEQEFDCSVGNCIMLFYVFLFNRASPYPEGEGIFAHKSFTLQQ